VDKAIAYLLRAGEKARRSYHNEEAVSFLQRGLDVLEGCPIDASQMGRRLAVLRGLAHVCFAVGRVADAEAHFRQALALGRDLGLPPRDLTLLYFWLANTLWWQARFAEMQRLCEEGLALLGDDLESVAGVLMNHTVGLAYIEQGQIDRGNGFFLRNAACLEGLPYDADLKLCYGDLIDAYLVVKKDVAAARRWLTHLEALAQHRREDLLLLAWVETYTALFLSVTGDVRGALGHCHRARDAFARCSTSEEGRSFLGTGHMHLSLGELGSAEEQAARGLSVLESVGARGMHSDLHRLLGTTALCRRATETAVAHFQTAARLYRDAAQPWLAAGAAVALGRAFLAQGAYGAALRAFDEAIQGCIVVDQMPQTPSPLRCFFGPTLPNALSGIEEASSSVEHVTAVVERLWQEFPAAQSLPQTPCLHPAAAMPFPDQHVHEQFTGALSAAWCWHDPQGDCSFTAQDGLLIVAANMRDLWHVNLSAPRLLQPAPSGDFAVQTVCGPIHAGVDQPAIGGLILWQDPLHYLVLERGHFGAADISFRGCLDGADCFIGRGRLPAERIWLRLERLGRRVTALCSADGQDWSCAGTIEFPTPDGVEVMVGLHAIGTIDRTIYHGAYPEGTAIYFTTFEMWTTAAA
jgi:tetratricopeptide (TPR) repeat protein